MVSSIVRISNNLIKHQSFVYTLLSDQTVLFQAIQFSISQSYMVLSIVRYIKQFNQAPVICLHIVK